MTELLGYIDFVTALADVLGEPTTVTVQIANPVVPETTNDAATDSFLGLAPTDLRSPMGFADMAEFETEPAM
jgi:hypothetical protein